MAKDMETTEIYEVARKTIKNFHDVGTEKGLLARYIAEDISLAVVENYGQGDDARYLLDAIGHCMQSWCNPALEEECEN